MLKDMSKDAAGPFTEPPLSNGPPIILRQPEHGYRHAIDPILLSHFCRPQKNDRVFDLGTGNGIIPLILARKDPTLTIQAIEIQSELYKTAMENLSLNSLADRISLIHGDMKDLPRLLPEASVDLVVSNPPYIRRSAGRLNPDSEKAIARHEIMITLDELLETAHFLMRPLGRFAVIYPARRAVDLLCRMRAFAINPTRIRFVHPRINAGAKLVLVEGMKKKGTDVTILPPLALHDPEGDDTEEIRRMFLP